VLDVRELHVQAVGAAAAVAEVHLSQAFGGDVTQLPLARAGVLGVEEAGCAVRGQGVMRGCQRARTTSSRRCARSAQRTADLVLTTEGSEVPFP
jgi:hypothetical protein